MVRDRWERIVMQATASTISTGDPQKSEEVGANFGVRNPKNFTLRGDHGNPCLTRNLDRSLVFLRKVGREQHLADVVEHAGHISGVLDIPITMRRVSVEFLSEVLLGNDGSDDGSRNAACGSVGLAVGSQAALHEPSQRLEKALSRKTGPTPRHTHNPHVGNS